MRHPSADHALAARLEALAAREMRRFAETAAVVYPDSSAAWERIAGGVAAFTGASSPVNQATGLGFDGPVTAEMAERLEGFYRERGARPVAQVCPLAHPSLWLALGERGWVADGFENVLVRSIEPDFDATVPPGGVEIRECETAEERDTWALVAANAFSAPEDPTPAQVWIARIVIARPGSRLLLAYVDGAPAATGELYIDGGVGWLSADSTLPQFRRRGLQYALQQRRLEMAAAAGCDLAATESMPGSASQRNQERAGFRIVYTRVDLAAPTATRREDRA